MEKWVAFILVALGAGFLLPDQGVRANPVRHYGTRMEALFVRMDSNRDGRLEIKEVRGQPYLKRRLQRHPSRNYLLIEDIRPSAIHPSGLRLQRRITTVATSVESPDRMEHSANCLVEADHVTVN